MKKLIFLLSLVCGVAVAQVGPPPATPAEAAAGTDRYKYLTPYAASQGGLSSPTGGVSVLTAVNISATNAAWETQTTTNALTRNITNQWSRGSGRYYGPVITDGPALPQNNGWGSIDLQSPQKSPVGVPSLGSNTNSAGGWNCFIGGGEGNVIYQNQEGYDFQGWKTIGSSIGGGNNNTMINADTCGIGMGDSNYLGPSSGSPQNYVDDSFIPFGISCAVFDTIDAMAMGWACTNTAGGGSMVMGWHSSLESGGTMAYGEEVHIRGQTHAIGGIGKSILLTNALNSFAIGLNHRITATNAGAIGIGLTNTTNGDWLFGVGSKALTVKSNGNVVAAGTYVSPLLDSPSVTGPLQLQDNVGINLDSSGFNTIYGDGTDIHIDSTFGKTTLSGEVQTLQKFTVGSGGPTITAGSGAPSSSEPNGSLYLRTDGSTTTTLYVRISGAWVGK